LEEFSSPSFQSPLLLSELKLKKRMKEEKKKKSKKKKKGWDREEVEEAAFRKGSSKRR
jgi:hypothetical protein